MKKAVLWGALVLALLLIGGVAALVGDRMMRVDALPNETRVRTFQDWRVICPPHAASGTPMCVLTHDTLRDAGNLWMTLSISDPTPGSALALKVAHGVLLQPGLGFAVGNGPIRTLPYETCIDTGCVAQITTDAELLKALAGNPSGTVTVMVSTTAPPARIPFSLRGFAEGYADLQRVKEQNTSMFGFLSR